ncbi:MAG TPA: matrixin family metalloprotease [Acidimicrobiales bacterium]|nr:matrixin family metalloprotease [Acidimicrobiales bacterium]
MPGGWKGRVAAAAVAAVTTVAGGAGVGAAVSGRGGTGLAAATRAGTAPAVASATGTAVLGGSIAAVAATPDGKGLWLAGTDGGVLTDGDAPYLGSMGGTHLAAPIVGMAATPDGRGYWLVAADGGIFTFGDAGFHGSAGALPLQAPVVGMAADPRTGGYWLVAADGGIFAYGVPFDGSAGSLRIQAPVVAIVPTPDGGGYRLVGRDGGIFTFGDAGFFGSAPGSRVVGAAPTPDGRGYWLAGPAGSVESFGTAPDFAPLGVSLAPAPGSSVGSTAGSGPFAFERTNADGTPARWNPCQPIRYVVNLSQAPAGALQMISSVLTEVSQATGLQFSYAGPSTELATNARPLTEGGSWSPVLIVWEATGQSDFLPNAGEVGMGGFTAVTNPAGQWVDVTGQVALSSGGAANPGFSADGGWTHLLLHEIGHVVGLAHVTDPSQVMYPVAGPGAPTSYGAGDVAGLRRLGQAGGCLAEPSAQAFRATS